ncbi:MAG: hypothetical protein AB1650_03175 [Candidatus Omnitrophota bacterium]
MNDYGDNNRDWRDDYDEYEEYESLGRKKESFVPSEKKLNSDSPSGEKGHKKRNKYEAKNRYMRKHRDDFKW